MLLGASEQKHIFGFCPQAPKWFTWCKLVVSVLSILAFSRYLSAHSWTLLALTYTVKCIACSYANWTARIITDFEIIQDMWVPRDHYPKSTKSRINMGAQICLKKKTHIPFWQVSCACSLMLL